ncbi:MAG: glycosyltransferase family 2 protein [Elusimicrobiota bacterium]
MQERVSVVIPCLNEAAHISDCLESILRSDYGAEKLEIIVVDGGSTDGTIAIIREFMGRFPGISLISNPNRSIPTAVNLGVATATSDIIFRMDAHSTYSESYVRAGVKALAESGASNVGGGYEIIPFGGSLVAQGISIVARHPAGAGREYSRLLRITEPRWTDFVSFGCFRRETFERISGFDERLERGEDADFNARLVENGGRVLFVPEMRFSYRARGTLKQLARHSFRTGYWAISANKIVKAKLTFRSLVPAASLFGCLILFGAGAVYPFAGWCLAAFAAAYLLLLSGVSTHAAFQAKDCRLVLMLPPIFLTLHCSHAAGSILGLFAKVNGER